MVFEDNGRVITALTLDISDNLIVDVRVVTNPDKLVALQPDHDTHRADLPGHRG